MRSIFDTPYVYLAAVLLTVMPVASPAEPPTPPLSVELASAMEQGGIDAAEQLYRRKRDANFADVHESEADTNAYGYALLGRGDATDAVRILRLNTQTHPNSANAFDSLGEACLAASDTACAVAAYQGALAIDPKHRAARYELHRLIGRPLSPFPFLVLLHIIGGALGILSGAVAMLARKGRRTHVWSGRVFAAAMTLMGGSAVLRAGMQMETEALNFWMGSLTLYLVATGWRAAHVRAGPFTLFDRMLAVLALLIAGGLLALATRGGGFALPAAIFGVIVLVAGVSDIWQQWKGFPRGPRRIARHWWRMALAMFIAVGSFFLGQAQVFAYSTRQSGILLVPPTLIVLSMLYWLAKYQVERFVAWRSTRQEPPAATRS